MRVINFKSGTLRLLALTLCVALAMPLFAVTPALAVMGGTTDNSGLIVFQQAYFAFEVEDPLDSLKGSPIWDEVEQMLDNPYAFVYEPLIAPNYQGFPSYRSTIPRRRSFVFRDGAGNPCAPGSVGCVEVPHTGFLVHPLNYLHTGGEELRLVNINYPGGDWTVPDLLVMTDPGDPTADPPVPPTVTWTYRTITVTPGIDRVEDDEAAADMNSPIAPDTETCIIATEAIVIYQDIDGNPCVPGSVGCNAINLGEGVNLCGGDPGEPNYFGFGQLDDPDNPQGYSTPAVPLPAGATLATILDPAVDRLYDPVRGFIGVRDPVSGGIDTTFDPNTTGLLRKPSLRIVEFGGTGALPNYAYNNAENLLARAAEALDDSENAPAYLVPSNENDYYAGATRAEKQTARDFATVMGKALFWDMQVGSDGVQACGSCHFHAGADNRTKNQLTPDFKGSKGNKAKFEVEGKKKANKDVTPGHFPFHRLADIEIMGDPACETPLISTNPINGQTRIVCDKNNILDDSDDVMSSMGVVFRRFQDVVVGANAFIAGTNPPVVKRDKSTFPPDPIPVFQLVQGEGHGLRRVEPRNTPTLFQAALNFDNFWDGRARHDFNGGSVFGASDPQAHVMVDMGDGNIQATRQIIRFSSLASLVTGPALSNFEMSGNNRNWAKIAKKLLQPGVTPLANQLVDPTDSVLGPYSNQTLVGPGVPGITVPPHATSVAGESGYVTLIRHAFYPQLWQNTTMHLKGCYTDGNTFLHPNQCAPGTVSIPVFDPDTGTVVNSKKDPFDNYVLSIADGAADPLNTNQFTQMEANLTLFAGLSVQAWGHILVPDDTPYDRFMDANPDVFKGFGESGEPFLVIDLLNCFGENSTGGVQSCFTEVGNFKRDSEAVTPILNVRQNCTLEGGQDCELVPSHGTRVATDPDPLFGFDFFLGSNFSLKNPNFRSLRCGECHAGGTLTDHTFGVSHQIDFIDWVPEFVQPGLELFPEPLGRGRIISGFLLEGELQENAQDGLERNIVDLCIAEPCVDSYGALIPGGVHGGFPQGQALLDNGMYNLGIRPIDNDLGRGDRDPFGWPMSLSYLALKNLGGVGYSPGGDNRADGFAIPPAGGIPLPNFEPDPLAINPDTGLFGDPTGGGLFEPNAQDQQINPGFGEEPANPLLPPHLAPWASNIPVGDEINIDELFVGLNTLMAEPMLEGFVDTFGPFNPAGVLGEAFNSARGPEMAMWPNVNRVNVQGAFKAAPLRNVELTGPYFHTGSKLTLRQQLDFYDRGGDFSITNKDHRDFLLVRLDEEDEALGGCVVNPAIVPLPDGMPPTNVPCLLPDGTPNPEALPEFTDEQKEAIKNALIDFLLELTDERVAFDRAPFDHPEIFVPLDGKAPDNTFGRPGFLARLANGRFRQVLAVGAGGNTTRLPNFLGVSSLRRTLPDGSPNPAFPAGAISHFDSLTGFADVTLIAPNGGEVIDSSDPLTNPFTISWGGPDDANIDHYRLELSKDNGQTWTKIAGPLPHVPGGPMTYDWVPPNPNRERPKSLIRVIAFGPGGGEKGRDRSNSTFTLVNTP